MENVVYHIHNPTEVQRPSKLSSFLNKISKFFFFLGIILIFFAYLPSLVFWIEGTFFGTKDNFKLTEAEVQNLTAEPAVEEKYMPPYDPRLPKENRLIVQAIGVDTPIQEATYDNFEEALKNGVWRVSDFGAPGEEGIPVILAAHRYGYIYWTNTFRRLNSFYNLPKLKVGDVVEIYWHQRKFTYEIYAESRGEEITDYSANLILYTCESLNGPVRIFKYARLLKI